PRPRPQGTQRGAPREAEGTTIFDFRCSFARLPECSPYDSASLSVSSCSSLQVESTLKRLVGSEEDVDQLRLLVQIMEHLRALQGHLARDQACLFSLPSPLFLSFPPPSLSNLHPCRTCQCRVVWTLCCLTPAPPPATRTKTSVTRRTRRCPFSSPRLP